MSHGDGSDVFGGVTALPITTFESLGAFRITWHGVSYSKNAAANRMELLGVSDVADGATHALTNGNGFGLHTNFNNDEVLQVVSGGTKNSNGLTSNVDYTQRPDVSIEYDGSEVRVLIDGEQRAAQSYSTNATFRPIVQLFADSAVTASETLEVQDITVEEL